MPKNIFDGRIFFKRFIGLKIEQKAPDETTFVDFRKRFREHGHIAILFDKTIETLESRGLTLEEDTCVDATIVETPKGRITIDGLSTTKEPFASYIKKHEDRDIFCRIIQRKVRGQKELTHEQKWYNRFTASIHTVVEYPFAWMSNTGYHWVRYRGLSRNGLDFGLHAIAYNFKSLTQMA
jgi:hypothetical protein